MEKTKYYIVVNKINENLVGVYYNLKIAQSVKKKMEKSFEYSYSILETELIKEINES